MAQKGILSCSIDDKQELYRCYMPFLVNGGLFIPTRKRFRLGDEVLVLLTLMGEERMAIPGRVAWLTPHANTRSSANSGVGIQFQDTSEGEQAQHRIASELAGMLESDRPTRTL
ncbi:MAG: PilZ domain-containing protein [Wenzhouxiangellaceae bacterium]|nr:PilZ domain-containing protein [Wenzhouxiangellaceae bacterium]